MLITKVETFCRLSIPTVSDGNKAFRNEKKPSKQKTASEGWEMAKTPSITLTAVTWSGTQEDPLTMLISCIQPQAILCVSCANMRTIYQATSDKQPVTWEQSPFGIMLMLSDFHVALYIKYISSPGEGVGYLPKVNTRTLRQQTMLDFQEELFHSITQKDFGSSPFPHCLYIVVPIFMCIDSLNSTFFFCISSLFLS